jgi:DNA-binding transcriptional MerR regulator
MGWVLGESAKRTGCSERTLRRYINGGLLRGRRVAGGQLELSQAEETYLRGHWTLLSKLMAALRTERDVRQAEEQPSLLADVMREGRVLIDRDDLWGALRERRDEILAAGAREDEQIMTAARATLAAASERLAQRDGGADVTGVVARA